MVGCVSGCVGTAGCHTLLHLCKSVLSVGDPSLQEASVLSVKSVGENHSKKVLCRSVKSVGEYHSEKVRVKSVGGLFWLRGVYPPTEQTGRGCSPTDFTDSHRWLVALMVAWVWQGCHTLLHLCKSVLSVGDPSLQEGSVQICEICGRIVLVAWGLPFYRTDRQKMFSHGFHRFSQMVGCVSGCVGTAGCHTLLHLCKSVKSVGENRSKKVL